MCIAKQLGWPSRGGRCLYCGVGAVEDVRHFVLECKRFDGCLRFWNELRAMLVANDDGGNVFLRLYWSLDLDDRLLFLLGGSQKWIVDGVVRWMVEKAFKNFLVACWKFRQAVIGVVAVRNGQLFVSPPVVVAALPGAPVPVLWDASVVKKFECFWGPYVVNVKSREAVLRSGSGGRAPFFVVSRGRQTGIFDSWERCAESVSGFKGAVFKGCFSLSDAKVLWAKNALT